MKILTRDKIKQLLAEGDPTKELKLQLRDRAIALAAFLLEQNAVTEYFEINKFDVEYEFFTHIIGLTGRSYPLNKMIKQELNFSDIENTDLIASYCYGPLFDQVFMPAINKHSVSDVFEVHSFTLREKGLDVNTLQYNLDSWAPEYSLVRFILNDTSRYINVVMIANQGNVRLFKDVYNDNIHYSSKPSHQDYQRELLRVLGSQDINTYRQESFREPWLSKQKLDYKREIVATKDWIKDFNARYKSTLSSMQHIFKNLPDNYSDELFIASFWSQLPSYYKLYMG
jgi:hypothetical protein